MTKEPFIAHSELTNEIYIVVGKEKYRVTEQAIKAVMAIKALEQEDVLDKIREEIEQNAYPIVHGFNNRENGMTLYGILQIIDKYRESEG